MGKRQDVEQVQRVVVEAKAKHGAELARVEAMIAEIHALQGNITSGFWEIGRILRDIQDNRYFGTLGFETLEQLCEARLGFSKAVASKLITVATQLPKPEAIKIGQERAYAVIAYTRALKWNGALDPADLIRRDAPIVPGKPLSSTPVREILAARPPKPKRLAERKASADDAATERALKRQLGVLGVPRGEVEVRAGKVTVTWSRAQIDKLLRKP